MRVIIGGSQEWTNPDPVRAVLAGLEALTATLGQPLTVVHGDCPRGVDAIADRWLLRRQEFGTVPVVIERHPWPKNSGPAGGVFRTKHMVNLGADLCVGFSRDGSSGTAELLRLAREAGISTHVVLWSAGSGW